MKNIQKFVVAIILFVIPFGHAQAQTKVAHIEVQKLISEMPEVIAAQKELEKLEKTYQADLETTFKEFQTKAQSYAADAENQTEIINQKRQAELESMQQGLQQFRENAAQDIQKKQMDLMRPLYEKARQAIENVAAAQGFEYVLDSSNGGSVIIAKGKDLMADVKKELGF
ncbi:MAG: OmpH family outer membrane protein [Bacteroidetes bacterium]|nr:OmpH family outer membrane protein [Bacteroidota bacterium]MDA0937945.1 OmpH family outer membrane protein [Bacteroidota bacterium]MDA1344025.1 OmpH family outer membrane protein [Bacteroidota bacterium]